MAAAVKPLVLVAVPRLCRPDLQTKELGCLICRDDARVRGSTTAVEIGGFDLDPALLDGSLVSDRSEHVARARQPATAARPCDCADDLAEIMSQASDVDDVILPIHEEVAPAHHGLSEAEEAALLGGVEQSVLDPFVPAWEVDAFRWPDLCTQLDEASGRKLAQSGDELYMAMQDGLKVIAITSTERRRDARRSPCRWPAVPRRPAAVWRCWTPTVRTPNLPADWGSTRLVTGSRSDVIASRCARRPSLRSMIA